MPLNRDQIIDAAIRILDEEGPDALSMRHLGTELDAGATSVYWHVKGKDDLLDLVADRVIGEVLAGLVPADTWRDWMAAFARSMRRVLLAHPGVAPVVGRRVGMGPNALLALEEVFPLLAADGFGSGSSMLATTTLVGWTTTLVLARSVRRAKARGSRTRAPSPPRGTTRGWRRRCAAARCRPRTSVSSTDSRSSLKGSTRARRGIGAGPTTSAALTPDQPGGGDR